MSDIEIGTQGSHKYPSVPVVEGEYNRQESPRRVWDKFSPPDYGYKVKLPQEYVLTSEEYAVNQIKEYVSRLGSKNHCGGANWIFSDTTSGGRNDCEVTRAGGEVDAARLPKEAFYVCKVMFDAKPQVHIIGHWTYPADRKTVKNIYVASNCDSVELFINGKSLGEGIRSDHYLFTFRNITYQPGVIEARGSNAAGSIVAKQTKETVGKAVKLRLTPISGPDGFRADGSDVVLIDVEAVDAKGRRHPTIQQRVDFEISGPGIWRGGYNSGKIKSTNNKYLDIECGINRVAIRSTLKPGTITLTAKSKGLMPAKLSIESLPVKIENGVMQMLPASAPQIKPDPAAIPHSDEIEEGTNVASEGRYIKGFSYSGHSMAAKIATAANGNRAYLDRNYELWNLPSFLEGADYTLLPNDEKLYEALDLINFRVAVAGTLYIAHDDRLTRPQWLLDSFKKTSHKIKINHTSLTLFSKKMHKNESITLGSNREKGATACTMYVVFFAPE
jgi:beta-galactosidase